MSPLALFAAAVTVASSAAHSEGLDQRFKALSCAVVRIEFDGGSGTGFIIDKNGHIATAAHVLYERHWLAQGNQIVVKPVPHTHVTAVFYDNKTSPVTVREPLVADSVNAGYDLAFASTPRKGSCIIPISKDDTIVGQHVLSIGYPNDNPAPVLYEGFVSSLHVHSPVPLGPVDNVANAGALASYNVMRLQMPVTPGASGSPVINDEGRAVGIISEVPVVIAGDVSQLANLARNGQGSGIRLSGFDTNLALGELAAMVEDFESPGSAFAVPTYYSSLP